MVDATLQLPSLPAMISLRGDAAAIVRAGATLGLALPVEPNCFTVDDGRTALWIGPDEWLILDDTSVGATVETMLSEALAGEHAAVCDVSGNRVVMRIVGADAAAVLARGCSLNFDEALAAGRCAGTLVGRVQAIVLRRLPEVIDIIPRRSFVGYLSDWLRAAIIAAG